MCLAQGPQRSDADEARTCVLFGLESSTLPLSHCAPNLPQVLDTGSYMSAHVLLNLLNELSKGNKMRASNKTGVRL